MPLRRADEKNDLPFGLEAERNRSGKIGNDSNPADRRGGQDSLAIGLVIERDITGDNGVGEGATGLGHATNAADKLPHNLRPFRIAEIQIVGDGQRGGADGCQVPPVFGYRLHAAPIGIGLAIAGRAIDAYGGGLAFGTAFDADNSGIATRPLYRIAADQAIILLLDPTLAGKVRRREKPG